MEATELRRSAPEKTCCFSGHRSISDEEIFEISDSLEGLIRIYRAEGITNFIAGGARGFDMTAGMAVVKLREEYPELRLTLAIPHRGHTGGWDIEEKDRLERLIEKADDVIYLSERYYAGCMFVRNRYMVDHSRYLICFLRDRSGGTVQTVRYAMKQGLNIKNLYIKGEH